MLLQEILIRTDARMYGIRVFTGPLDVGLVLDWLIDGDDSYLWFCAASDVSVINKSFCAGLNFFTRLQWDQIKHIMVVGETLASLLHRVIHNVIVRAASFLSVFTKANSIVHNCDKTLTYLDAPSSQIVHAYLRPHWLFGLGGDLCREIRICKMLALAAQYGKALSLIFCLLTLLVLV